MPVQQTRVTEETAEAGTSLLDIGVCMSAQWRSLLGVPLLAGVLTIVLSYLIPPTFTSEALLLPPSQQQSSLSALSGVLGGSAGALAGAGLGGLKDQNDQWIAILRSRTVADNLVDKFDLGKLYGEPVRFKARERLADNTHIEATKQGLISIRVDDHDPARAQQMARWYVKELQQLSNTLAVSAAAQRRVFFEQQLHEAGGRLAQTEIALRGAGVGGDVLRTSPQATVEGVVALERRILESEVQLSSLRSTFADASPQISQVQARLAELRRRLEAQQKPRPAGNDAVQQSYVAKYRAFKYAETVFDGIARQLEVARLEEAREGAHIQLLDDANRPEWKSSPKRAVIGVLTFLGVFLIMLIRIIVGAKLISLRSTTEGARAVDALRSNLRLRRRARAG